MDSAPEMLFLYPRFIPEENPRLTFEYCLGTGYILAYLKNKGLHAAQFIHSEHISLEDLGKKILNTNAGVIGFTCYDSNYYFIKIISQMLKNKKPGLKIILGGPTATFSSELIMADNPAIDICVRGEGEITAYELIETLRSSQNTSKIQGITYRINGKIIKTLDRPLITGGERGAELDVFPSPYLSGVIPGDGKAGILTARGCVYKCTYCNFSAMSRWRIRYHSVERVIAELKLINKISEERKEQVGIQDDAFSLNIERAKKICRRIMEEKIHLPLWAETRADTVDEALIRLMKKAGFQSLNFGLESAVPKVLKAVKKVRNSSIGDSDFRAEKIFLARVKKSVALTKKLNMDTSVSVILGLPTATIKDDAKTLDFVKRLNVTIYYHNYLTIYPGTELFSTYAKYGLKIRNPLTLLPYKVKNKYNVFKLPLMAHAYQNIIYGLQIENLMMLLTGGYNSSLGDNYPDILLKDVSAGSSANKWLISIMAMCPLISFADMRDDSINKSIERLIRSGAPIGKFFMFQNSGKKVNPHPNTMLMSSEYKIRIAGQFLRSRNSRSYNLSSINFVPFSNFNPERPIAASRRNSEDKKLLFTLSTPKDIENLIKIGSRCGNLSLKRGIIKEDCYFLDECRWACFECPAKRFRRVMIGKDGLILPCVNGKPIGRVGDGKEKILKNLNLLWEKTLRERGCDACAVKNSCSKCLFPYPIDSREYCWIKRNEHANINKPILLFRILRKLRLSENGALNDLKADKIKALIDDKRIKIVTVGNNRYCYNEEIDKIAKI